MVVRNGDTLATAPPPNMLRSHARRPHRSPGALPRSRNPAGENGFGTLPESPRCSPLLMPCHIVHKRGPRRGEMGRDGLGGGLLGDPN